MKTLLLCCFLLFFNIIPAVLNQCMKDQQLSLLHLKKSLIFDEHPFDSYPTKVLSWNSSTDCCSWLGVTCSTDGRAVGLDLSRESISGGIDNSSSLFNLQHLQSLSLADNRFGYDSSIPSAIGKLTNLRYLNLSDNEYSGKIPIEISLLTRLVVLDISYVQAITSPKFSMLFQNLIELTEVYLDAADLSAQGTQWCQAISSSLPNLEVLSLSNCGLSGPIDQSLAKLQSLSVIQLEYNNISAPLPGFFANFSKLSFLSLRGCWLQGLVAKEIFQIPTLQTIDLSLNQELHGSLPELPNNGSLRHLDLTLTKFSGLLPDSIGNLNMLSMIDLSGCSFTGSIPKTMGNLTQLVYLDLSSNMFNGPIDSIHWEKLINLVQLQLNDNLLEGSIPLSLFCLPLLPELFLFKNHFFGQLPDFSNGNVSSNLIVLDFSFNNLEGQVPVSIFNFRGLTLLDLSSNNFSGFPFNGPQQLTNLSSINLSYNSVQILYNGTSSSYSSFPQIDSLTLASNKLRTILDFLRNQSTLGDLDLSANHISGEIPNWIWSVPSLNLSCNYFVTLKAHFLNSTDIVRELDLHSNQLQGQIPTFLRNARYLDYSRNNFSSSIPPNIGDFISNISFLSLSSNNLHGLIPPSLCNASFDLLDLSDNFLSGMIPECLTTTGILRILNLRRNNLTGTISNFRFPEQSLLQTLDLSGNQIEGQFPKSLANCTLLEILNLGNNHIKDTFPCLLMDIISLRVLVLRSNKFFGRIGCPKTAKTYETWGVLQIIDLAHNHFGGEIPGRNLKTWQAMMANKGDSLPLDNYLQFSQDEERGKVAFSFEDAITITSKGSKMDLAKILAVFTLIDFSGNKFNGPIPKEIGEFKSLYILNLSANAFTGEIPSSFGNMRQLESLDLSHNNLSGHIPPQLAKLTFLSFLNLSINQLVGKIPTGTQFSTFPKDSFTGNKGLWGAPLTVDDNKAGLSPPPTLNGGLPNSEHEEIDWDLLSVEIGFAFGCAIATGSLVFCKRWSKWYYKAMYDILVKIFPQLEERIGNHKRHVHVNQRWRR